MAGKVIIVDCGEGNVNSVQKMMDRISPGTRVTSSPADVASSDKIILPGIGHFRRAMEALDRYGLLDPLHEAVVARKKPILGICLGMQLMAKESEEGDTKGLGWMNGNVVRFNGESPGLKIPHMGWNTVVVKKQSMLMRDVADGTEFYFAHSYRWATRNPAEILCETEYGVPFPSAIEKDNIFGVQFHPEKSHDGGLQILRNFASI